MAEASRPAFDAYKVLQVDPEADPEVVQAAYRRLAQKYHPDIAGTDAAERMRQINAAWEILRDPGRRADYDRSRAAATAGRPVDGAPGSQTAGGRRPPGHAPGGEGPEGQPGGSGSARPPERVSGDWTTGRSSFGATYDPVTMRSPDGEGAAGPPPGNPSGSVLNFGRYAGWSLGEISRRDLEYIEWLDRVPIGRAYRDEIDAILRRSGRRTTAADTSERRGLFRRR
jgi:curved DNA-binding protein CbpA